MDAGGGWSSSFCWSRSTVGSTPGLHHGASSAAAAGGEGMGARCR